EAGRSHAELVLVLDGCHHSPRLDQAFYGARHDARTQIPPRPVVVPAPWQSEHVLDSDRDPVQRTWWRVCEHLPRVRGERGDDRVQLRVALLDALQRGR